MAEIKNLYENQSQSTNPFDLIGTLSAGRAIQDSLDDQGNVDANKFSGLIKQSGPLGALHAIPTLTAIQQLRQAGHITEQEDAKAQQEKAGVWQQRWGMMNAVAAPLRSKKDLSRADIYDAAVSLLTQPEAQRLGITMPMIMENVINQMPKGKDGKPPSSAELASWLDRQNTMVMGAGERMNALSPMIKYEDDGGVLRPIDENPRSPTFGKQVGPAIAKQVAPGTQVFPEKGGAPTYAEPQGINNPYTELNPSGAASGAQGASTAAPATQSGTSTGQTAPNAPKKALRAANPPGFTQASDNEANAGADMGNELVKAADSSPNRRALLGNLKNLAKNFDSGPGADLIRTGKAFINSRMPEGIKPFDPKSIAAQEEFNKQSVQLAQQQFQAIGGTGTDAKFNSAYETSPNETLSNMGNEGIIGLLQGNEDAIAAKAKEWNIWRKSGNGPNTYKDFSLEFNKHFDPRVFQFKYMSPETRQSYLDQMPDDDARRRFLKDIKAAVGRGWVTPEQVEGKKK